MCRNYCFCANNDITSDKFAQYHITIKKDALEGRPKYSKNLAIGGKIMNNINIKKLIFTFVSVAILVLSFCGMVSFAEDVVPQLDPSQVSKENPLEKETTATTETSTYTDGDTTTTVTTETVTEKQSLLGAIVDKVKEDKANEEEIADEKAEELKKNPEAELFILGDNLISSADGKIYSSERTFSFVIPSEINGKEISRLKERFLFGNEEVTAVLIPSSIKTIGAEAFANCSNLTTIVLLGRSDIDDLDLGDNWSGDADVIFEFIAAKDLPENEVQTLEASTKTSGKTSGTASSNSLSKAVFRFGSGGYSSSSSSSGSTSTTNNALKAEKEILKQQEQQVVSVICKPRLDSAIANDIILSSNYYVLSDDGITISLNDLTGKKVSAPSVEVIRNGKVCKVEGFSFTTNSDTMIITLSCSGLLADDCVVITVNVEEEAAASDTNVDKAENNDQDITKGNENQETGSNDQNADNGDENQDAGSNGQENGSNQEADNNESQKCVTVSVPVQNYCIHECEEEACEAF